jgi:hypothetical protein
MERSEVDELTLRYMTNCESSGSANCQEKRFTREDRRFYKLRILAFVKNILKGGKAPADVADVTDDFMASIVEHLKMVDRRDILQERYKGLKADDDEKGGHVGTQDDPNKLLMAVTEPAPPSLDDFVVKTSRVEEDRMPPPEKKTINLADPALMTKNTVAKVRRKRVKPKKE